MCPAEPDTVVFLLWDVRRYGSRKLPRISYRLGGRLSCELTKIFTEPVSSKRMAFKPPPPVGS